MTVKHLHRYLAEFEYRWDTRRTDDFQKIDRLMRDMRGKRLKYVEQVAAVAAEALVPPEAAPPCP